jgi:2-polyprenyl-6-methoxyphenol hydroxylase-like FAD-dependent oxidoreductase
MARACLVRLCFRRGIRAWKKSQGPDRGGGIGGITTALALRQRGIECRLFEQAEAFRQVGAGIQISANATRILRRLGLSEALARVTDWRVGRAVLLGDAAHPMMPFYAQGAAHSIEDAYVLAGCFAASPQEPAAALHRYVRVRQPRTAWMQTLSRREEELYQMTDAAAIADRNARMRANRTPEQATFPPEQERLYGYDAEAVLREA